MAEQNQQRIWKALSAVVGNPRLPLMKLEGKLEDTPPVNADELVEKIVNESPAVRIAELGVKRAEAALARAKREPIPDLQLGVDCSRMASCWLTEELSDCRALPTWG
jgi:cobalt-zinc-cadmium efflux system outer membrane protein